MRTGNVTDCPPPTITAGGSSSVKEPEDSGLSQYTASAPAAARAGSSHRNRGQCRGGSGACQSPTSFSPCRDPADRRARNNRRLQFSSQGLNERQATGVTLILLFSQSFVEHFLLRLWQRVEVGHALKGVNHRRCQVTTCKDTAAEAQLGV